jgi:MoaA/NifB/PqqE/SkfB family radical SAM enzyme
VADAPFRPNQFRHATAGEHPGEFREGRWRTFQPAPPVARQLRGRRWLLRPGLTFTPYANPTPCNAHCAFCSEELLREDADRLTAKTLIADHDRYFSALDRAWRDLEGFPMGLSFSGLEATSDPSWMLRLLALLDHHDALFPSRVLYTNGSGLCTDERLLPALARARFTRVELSRCHFDERTNHRIMRFDLAQPVRRAEVFRGIVQKIHTNKIPLKLVCILNRQGVATMEDVEQYLESAEALGVQQVVFRELSALGTLYQENRETRWIAKHRAPVRALMDAVLPESGVAREGWELLGVTSGYYYYNEVYRRGSVEVTLEGSSYVAHRDAQESGILQKLVFHSTGDLCGDWVPNAQVIGNYGSE